MSAATGGTKGPATPYAFDNDEPTAGAMLGSLCEMLDEFTTARLTRAGVAEGARCLEVGTADGWRATSPRSAKPGSSPPL